MVAPPLETVATLEVAFEVHGVQRTLVFTQRPLGMDLKKGMPMRVTGVKGQAFALGVRAGWTIEAVGGRAITEMTYPEAYEHFQHCVAPLRLSSWSAGTSVTSLQAKIQPPAPSEVAGFLERRGFRAGTAQGPQPKISLGLIKGHHEVGAHTWYILLCTITREDGNADCWQVERRLAHLRKLLHDPVKASFGKQYEQYFQDARFSHHGGPPGTTNRLRLWLRVLGECINEGRTSQQLVALVLSFVEAPRLLLDGRSGDDEKRAAVYVKNVPKRVAEEWVEQCHAENDAEQDSRSRAFSEGDASVLADRGAGSLPDEEVSSVLGEQDIAKEPVLRHPRQSPDDFVL